MSYKVLVPASIIVCLIVAGSGFQPVAALALSGVGGRPAVPSSNSVRAQSMFIYTLRPGETRSDKLFLSNNSDSEQVVEIYSVDGVVTNLGSYTCSENIEQSTTVGSWIRFTQTQVTLSAKDDKIVDFDLLVPEGLSAREYNGCIVLRAKDARATDVDFRQTTSLQSVRVSVIVPGDIHRQIHISSFERDSSAELAKFNLAIANKGNVSADVDVRFVTSDLFGNIVHRTNDQYAVMADTNLRLSYSVKPDSFWGGFFSTKAEIAYDKRAGVYGTDDDRYIQRDTSKEFKYFVPATVWAILTMFGGLSLVVVGAFWLRQQLSTGAHEASLYLGEPRGVWTKYIVKSGDTLENIANEHAISTSNLSTINKLSESASLQEGQIIYVPKGC